MSRESALNKEHEFASTGGKTDTTRPFFGASPSGDAPEAAASGETAPQGNAASDLLDEVRSLLSQGGPLADRARHLARTHAALAWFLFVESARLYVARYAISIAAVVMFAACWIFMSIFLWIGIVELTDIWATGPLLLLATHAIAGILLLVWRERLTI